MVRKPFDRSHSAGEKRDLARRARRLAETQINEADRQRLSTFADDLEKEAEMLERVVGAVLPLPDAVPSRQFEQQQLQQQQAATQPDPKANKD